MTPIQLVVFDIAGTTVRDKGQVAKSFMDAFIKYHYDLKMEQVHSVMGFRKKDAIRMLLEECNTVPLPDAEELIEKIHDTFILNMVDFYKNDPDLAPLPYAEEVFALLKKNGVLVALNTGFTKKITDTILKRLNWNNSEYIQCVVSSDEVPKGRPFPFMIHSIMKTLKISDVHQVAKIGDTEVDIREGRTAACGMVISVTTGAYTRDQLAEFHPDHIIDSLSELPSLLHLN